MSGRGIPLPDSYVNIFTVPEEAVLTAFSETAKILLFYKKRRGYRCSL